jgi:hypothetical protein
MGTAKRGRGSRGHGKVRGVQKGSVGKSDSVENPVIDSPVDSDNFAFGSLDVVADIFPVIASMQNEIAVEQHVAEQSHPMTKPLNFETAQTDEVCSVVGHQVIEVDCLSLDSLKGSQALGDDLDC